MSRKAIAVLVVLGVLAVSCLGCMVSGVVGLWWSTRPPEAVAVRLDYPPEIQVGKIFQLVVWVHNQTTRPRMLNSIDLDWTWAQHFTVLDTQPAPARIGAYQGLGFLSYFFHAHLPAQEEVPITFTLRGKRNGTFHGYIDVCIDSSVRCVSSTLVLRVVP